MTKFELISAEQKHMVDDEAVHQILLEAVEGFDGDTDKLEKELGKHIKKTKAGHETLLELANAL